MVLQSENILIQMLVVLFPIILYQALINNRKLKRGETFYWSIVFSATMFLCLMFAIKIDDGIILDLRMVPWFLAFIYGGNAVGLVVSLFYVVIRFIVGGHGMYTAYIVLVLGTMVIWKFPQYYFNWDRKNKIAFSVLFLCIISFLLPLIGTLLFDMKLTKSVLIINIGFVVVNAVTVWLAVHLLESYREKQELMKEVQKNEKLQVVGQVAASVAHEIRNPMTSVRGFIQMLSTSKNINKDELSFLKICLDELDRANDIISDYLSLGKNNDFETPRLIDVSNMAAKSINTLISYATINNVQLTLTSVQTTYVLGIPSRLQQMLINIIKNAIEAARPNGHVTLSVNLTGKEVEITIIDDGIGMTPTQVENIGLPYYSTKEKGTGLGLMVTLQIIKEMNGRWNVKSELNRGTCFQINLPSAKNDAELDIAKQV
ncbi:HAMP domain-containing histidine kinase [Bacillus sp. DNRA2]|uniref:sensor histidine kinase n=1 Tax=Bacillus sp. DNRA2 TaxID=2723053 RepID=UPI00145DD8DE|nr:HAMP domain-containing sensor histidine kinase [Bacillus sp. DNRA2]NMD72852.1 HAMP domain-containing histidine kinase [Bacillus sp. DNRA2]